MNIHHVRGAVIGIVAFLGIVVGFIIAIVYLGYAPMEGDTVASAVEQNLAMKALHAVSERQMGDVKSPVPPTQTNLAAGLKIYQQNCIICHGASDGKPSNVATGFYVASPQFAKDGAEDDPEGATYWKIHHGIRFTAMPAFQKTLKETEIWQVAIFLRHMDQLPKPVDAAWKATTSVGGMNMASTPTMNMK
jgi:thiosulfate dehydrogenase